MHTDTQWPAVRILGEDKALEHWENIALDTLDASDVLGSARQVWYDPAVDTPDLEVPAGALVVYLRRGLDPAPAVEALRAVSDGSVQIEPFITPEADWATQWRRFFKPLAISPELAIIPSWYTIEEAAQALNRPADAGRWIRIEPGQAFGSGTHATTRLCLRALEQVMDPAVRSVLDFGAGSGILTIAAASLGAETITAVEIDPETKENFDENRKLNSYLVGAAHIDHRIGSSEQLKPSENFDLVVCNALYHRVTDHFPALSRAVASGGRLLYSGFLTEQRNAIASRLEQECGLKVQWDDREEEWGALCAGCQTPQ